MSGPVHFGWRDRALALLVAMLPTLAGPLARAADPQPYSVSIAPTGTSDLDKVLADASQLAALRDKAPVGPFALVSRARDDVERLETVLHSFGYYDGRAIITLDGHPLDDASLVDALEALPQSAPAAAKIAIETGPIYRLRAIAIEGWVPEEARARLDLKAGQPAVAAEVLAAGARLLTALQEEGYALAKVDPPVATADHPSHALEIVFTVDAGRLASIGPIQFKGLEQVHESFVRRRLILVRGELYQPSKIEQARLDLASLGIFAGVSVQIGKEIAADGELPVTFEFRERPTHAVGVTGAFSTDLGASVKTTWSDRNLFGNAEQLNLSAAATGLGGTDVRQPGYNATAQFLKPDFLQRDQSLEFDLGALQQKLQAYDQKAETFSAALHRKLSQRWIGSIGVSATQERITQEGISDFYKLLGLPLTVSYDSTGLADPLRDPTHGVRSALTATPTGSIGHQSNAFVILQASGATYFDFSDWGWSEPGRSVLALRGLVGLVEGAGAFDLPPDQRFYGGGSATVRGFKYQSIGPRFADGNPIGGTAIGAGTIEFRQRVYGDFGAAAFLDAGQVSGSRWFGGAVGVGTGVGLRYYTPIGPIRLDVAVPVNKLRGGDAFELYIGLGQAF